MFNLTVAEAHTFFVGNSGWLVHNILCGETYDWVKNVLTQSDNQYTRKHENSLLEAFNYYNRSDAILKHQVGGGVAGALIYEVEKGELLSTTGHYQKAKDARQTYRGLLKAINKAYNMPANDRELLTSILEIELDYLEVAIRMWEDMK